MNYEFDPAKDERNLDKHGVAMAEALEFEWDSAMVQEDTRRKYAEVRLQATGLIGVRLYVMIYCKRGDDVRIISLRKANPREVKRYVAEN